MKNSTAGTDWPEHVRIPRNVARTYAASEIQPTEDFSPGDYIREELRDRGWTQKELSIRMGIPLRTLVDLLTGHTGITPRQAIRLSIVFDTSPRYWMDLSRDWKAFTKRTKGKIA